MSHVFGIGESDLRLPPGRKPTDADFHRLSEFVAREQRLPGPGTTHTELPWGTITVYRGGGGGSFSSPFFAPSVESREGGAFAITWQKGTIGGVEPVIPGDTDVPLSGTDTLPPPSFLVPAEAFSPAGEALVYFELQITPNWIIERIVPVVFAAYPPEESWKARKLALLLRTDGTFWRALYSNQGWLAVNRRTNGRALQLFWGKY